MTNKTIFEIFKCNTIIYKLIEQQITYPINVAYKILRLKKQFDEIETLMRERWILLFGNDYDETNFNEEQISVYNTTLQTTIDIDLFQLKIEEVINNEIIKLTIDEVDFLNDFLIE